MNSCTSDELYRRIAPTLEQLVEVRHRRHLINWIWIVVGILQARKVALSEIATHIPGAASAASRVTTVRRWLKNLRVDPWTLYRPVLEHALAGWHAREATVVLDGTMLFGDRWQVYRLALLHGGRAIPLVWVILPGTGLADPEDLWTVLERAAEFLRPRVPQVLFLADRGFRDCDWVGLCQHLGWHYAIRVAHTTTVALSRDGCYVLKPRPRPRAGHGPARPTRHLWKGQRRKGWRGQINALGVQPGQRAYFQHVTFTATHELDTQLTVTWTTGSDRQPPELLALISDRPAARARLREYARRPGIEESFRDDKSAGFDLAHTRLNDPVRLERLLLAVAIATLWCHELGEQVLATGDAQRRAIDPGTQRELSLFQLGLRWLKRCLSTGVHRLVTFRARLRHVALPPVRQAAT